MESLLIALIFSPRLSGEGVERFVDVERLLLVAQRCGDLQLRHIEMFRPAAALLAMAPAGPLDEDSPHGLGSTNSNSRRFVE